MKKWSNGGSTNSLSKSLVNSIIFGKEIIMKKIKQKMKKWMLVGLSGAIALAMGSVAFAQEMVKDPTTGKMATAPEYGGTITFGTAVEPPNCDPGQGHPGFQCWFFTNEKLAFADWAIDRQRFGFDSQWVPDFAITGQLAESWEQTDPVTYKV